MSDQSLRGAIMEALASNPIVRPDEIAVEIRDGDVTLRGTVGSPLQQAEAVHTASGVPGVRHVEDQLRVRLMDYEGRADADTEAAVLDALIADDEVHAGDVQVESRDGAVTLSGLVEVPSQRERAERIAMGVPGVASVHNALKL